jgi:hypothetical protein
MNGEYNKNFLQFKVYVRDIHQDIARYTTGIFKKKVS